MLWEVTIIRQRLNDIARAVKGAASSIPSANDLTARGGDPLHV